MRFFFVSLCTKSFYISLQDSMDFKQMWKTNSKKMVKNDQTLYDY